MKRREQPIETLADGETYEVNLGPFNPKGSGVLHLSRPWTIETIPLGVKLRKLFQPASINGVQEGVDLFPPHLLQDRAVAEDAGTLLCQAWRHPAYELEHTGAAACDELIGVAGTFVTSMILSRIISEAVGLMSLDKLYQWEAVKLSSPPTKADEQPSASA